MSLITAKFGNYSIVIVAAAFSLLNCFWIAIFVIFPDSEQMKEDKIDGGS